MHNVASERLYEMLNWWKSLCYAREIGSIIMSPHLVESPSMKFFERWREYDRLVLDNSVPHLRFEDWDELTEFLPQKARILSTFIFRSFPFQLFEWNRKSRRVYHIPIGLQYLLMQGRYDRLSWGDVVWPYDAFVLTLERPLEYELNDGSWETFDTILAAKIPAKDNAHEFCIRLLRKPKGITSGILPERVIVRVLRLSIAHQDDRALSSLMKGLGRVALDGGTAQGRFSRTCFSSLKDKEGYIDHSSDTIRIEPKDIFDKYTDSGNLIDISDAKSFGKWERLSELYSIATRIVVGWALYMDSMVAANPLQNMYVPPSRPMRGIAGIITNPQSICTVLVKAKLDPARYVETPEREVSSSTFKRPHWRRAHLRRERGAPTSAPKTIRIPPTLIRKDLVPIFGLISGTVTEILDDE